MLKIKDYFTVRKLISSRELLISKEEEKELTGKDVSKIKFIYENFEFMWINWSLVKKVSLEQLIIFEKYNYDNLEDVITLLTNNYNIKEFITEILEKYRWSFVPYISRMVKLTYTLDQIKFIIENEMYFYKYHDKFDYYEFVDKVSKLGFDYRKEIVTTCSINFLESIKKLYSIAECNVLIAAKNNIIEFEFSEKEFLDFIMLCHNNKFSAYEIYTIMSLDKVCEYGYPIDFDFIMDEINKGKTKEDILEEQIESLLIYQ